MQELQPNIDSRVWTADRSFGLHFIVDKERDKRVLFNWNWDSDPAGLESRAAGKGISPAFARRLRDISDYEEVRKELDEYLDKLHASKAEELQSFIRDLKVFCSQNLERLVQVVTELTERFFYYPEYQVLVSPCHRGMVSGGISNHIGVGIGLHPEWRNRIFAHELVEEHWRKIFREERLTDKLDELRCWALSEIGAILVLKDERLKTLWTEQQQELDGTGFFGKSNYPQLAPVEQEIRKIFDSRKNLEQFLERAATALIKYSDSDLQEPVEKR